MLLETDFSGLEFQWLFKCCSQLYGIIWDLAILYFYDTAVVLYVLATQCIAVAGSLLWQICMLLHLSKLSLQYPFSSVVCDLSYPAVSTIVTTKLHAENVLTGTDSFKMVNLLMLRTGGSLLSVIYCSPFLHNTYMHSSAHPQISKQSNFCLFLVVCPSWIVSLFWDSKLFPYLSFLLTQKYEREKTAKPLQLPVLPHNRL